MGAWENKFQISQNEILRIKIYLFSILSLNATTLKLFMVELLIGLMQNSTALFLQRLMKNYSEQI